MTDRLHKAMKFGETFGMVSVPAGTIMPDGTREMLKKYNETFVGTSNLRKTEEEVSWISIDFSQLELKVLSHMMQERKEQWEAVRANPSFISYNRLRKSRARMMVEAMQNVGFAEQGNIGLDFENDEAGNNVFIFFYRGTRIAKWYPLTNVYAIIPCAFDDTSATMNQRKMVKEAIEEFNSAVFSV